MFATPSTRAMAAGRPVRASPAALITQIAAERQEQGRRPVVTNAQRAPTPAAGQNRARPVSGSTMRRPTTTASA